MRKILLILIGLISLASSAQVEILDSVQTENWILKGYTTPNMVFETIVYQDSITVKLIKGNSKAMNKLIGTSKFTKVFTGTVEVSDTEFLLKTKDYRITVTRGAKIVYTTVEEKDDFTGEVIKNIYFGKR
ncbi:hypothetical protein [Polaribacter sp. IC073]|uniref:hypothetical protein n=1 Tax=Polaribacter sp. IC073 TaxID=2508540 RepID=UPI0011BD5CAE|nr:hypothetical protein [Polaribacter sp. IC073]TXD48063.1 hypothetical protein ES045_09570 [Polaribacter sp. IC073]